MGPGGQLDLSAGHIPPIEGGAVCTAQEAVGYVNGDEVIRYLLHVNRVHMGPPYKAMQFDGAGVYLYALGGERDATLRADDVQTHTAP